MSKKKNIVISIFVVFVIILLVSGVSYAYLSMITNAGDTGVGSGMLDINYVAPLGFTGELMPSPDRSDGLMKSASVGLKDDSVDALFNMYLTPTEISQSLKISALKWEVEGLSGGTVVYTNSGDFSGAEVDVPIKIVNGYELNSTTLTIFNIYIWLDESLINTGISDAKFDAKISVDANNVTGEF